MNELRLQVERIVRPISATARRKDRIRQELHEHLVAAHQQELARGATPEQALATTIARFGDATQVRRELQATVPMFERIVMSDPVQFGIDRLVRKITRRPGEAALRCALRMSLFTFFATFLPSVIFCGIVIVLRSWAGEPNRSGSLSRFGFPVFGMLFVLHVLFPVLADGMRKAICAGFATSRSWLKATGLGVIAAFAAFGTGCGFLFVMNWSLRADVFRGFEDVFPWLLAAAAATPFLLALYAFLSARDIRRFDEDPWRFLEIEQ